MISSCDLGWIVGIIEGEGCIIFQHGPVIEVRMTDKDIIEKLHRLVKYSIMYSYDGYLRSDKTVYIFTLAGNPAVQWLMTIVSLLGVRRRSKAIEVINLWKSMPYKVDWRFLPQFCRRGHWLTEENIKISVRIGKHDILQRIINYSCRLCINENSVRRHNDIKAA